MTTTAVAGKQKFLIPGVLSGQYLNATTPVSGKKLLCFFRQRKANILKN
jgi:hypothetical protein